MDSKISLECKVFLCFFASTRSSDMSKVSQRSRIPNWGEELKPHLPAEAKAEDFEELLKPGHDGIGAWGSRLAETTESPQCLRQALYFCRTTDYGSYIYIHIVTDHTILNDITHIKTYKDYKTDGFIIDCRILLKVYIFVCLYNYILYMHICDTVDHGHWPSMWAVEEFLSWIDEQSKVSTTPRPWETSWTSQISNLWQGMGWILRRAGCIKGMAWHDETTTRWNAMVSSGRKIQDSASLLV